MGNKFIISHRYDYIYGKSKWISTENLLNIKTQYTGCIKIGVKISSLHKQTMTEDATLTIRNDIAIAAEKNECRIRRNIRFKKILICLRETQNTWTDEKGTMLLI